MARSRGILREHRYAPRGTAQELFRRREPEVLVSGPAGTGKSRACLEKMNMCALLNPGFRGLIVRKTAVSLTTTALATWRRFVIAEGLASGDVTYYGGSAVEPAQYRYTNGSTVMIGGMDRATRIMSSEYDMIFVQEATELTEDDWEALTTRLRNGQVSFQQLIADTNPSTPTHWLKLRADTGKTVMLNSSHLENPVLYTDDGQATEAGAAYMAVLDNLTGVRHARLKRGLWVAAEGLIYDEFDPAVQVVDKFSPPDDWARYWTVDFGFVNPFVCQWWAQNPDGDLYLYREIYMTRRLVEDHAKAMLAEVQIEDGVWIEPKPRAIITDHDAEGRATLQRTLGIATTAANKKVIDGIQATQKRVKDRRIFLCRDTLVERDQNLTDEKRPACTAEELPGYVWDTSGGKAPKEQPVKLDDHGMDAMRYLVMHVDKSGGNRMRWLG